MYSLCTLKLASTSAPSKTGTATAVTSAWVTAALILWGEGGLMCRTPDTSTAGALQHTVPVRVCFCVLQKQLDIDACQGSGVLYC